MDCQKGHMILKLVLRKVKAVDQSWSDITAGKRANSPGYLCHVKQRELTHYNNHTLLGHLLHTRKVPEYRPYFMEMKV